MVSGDNVYLKVVSYTRDHLERSMRIIADMRGEHVRTIGVDSFRGIYFFSSILNKSQISRCDFDVKELPLVIDIETATDIAWKFLAGEESKYLYSMESPEPNIDGSCSLGFVVEIGELSIEVPSLICSVCPEWILHHK